MEWNAVDPDDTDDINSYVVREANVNVGSNETYLCVSLIRRGNEKAE